MKSQRFVALLVSSVAHATEPMSSNAKFMIYDRESCQRTREVFGEKKIKQWVDDLNANKNDGKGVRLYRSIVWIYDVKLAVEQSKPQVTKFQVLR